MITILVDEAYAFDYLAILNVKYLKSPTEKNTVNLQDCLNHISNQIGNHNMNTMINSHEYVDLIAINTKTFDLIDWLRDGEQISAKTIDDANMERYYKKKAFQERFFPNSLLTEEKIIKE